ncbi:MAG: hypothetical protein Q8R31_05905 [Candidatus Omnitrophota bacterium]|nr:hypothetical protein [Candidatus Omnitrophota bacterium]
MSYQLDRALDYLKEEGFDTVDSRQFQAMAFKDGKVYAIAVKNCGEKKFQDVPGFAGVIQISQQAKPQIGHWQRRVITGGEDMVECALCGAIKLDGKWFKKGNFIRECKGNSRERHYSDYHDSIAIMPIPKEMKDKVDLEMDKLGKTTSLDIMTHILNKYFNE